MYELYSTKEKIYFQARAINNEWHQTFTSPKEFWSSVPKWEWRPIFTEKEVKH